PQERVICAGAWPEGWKRKRLRCVAKERSRSSQALRDHGLQPSSWRGSENGNMNPFAGMTMADVEAHNARVSGVVPGRLESPQDAVDREDKLHQEIIAYCGKKWPRWKFRHARMDRKTTEEIGTEDFTIFADRNRTFHFECKAKGKKRSIEQLGWAMQMRYLGHEVHCVESMSQFLA